MSVENPIAVKSVPKPINFDVGDNEKSWFVGSVKSVSETLTIELSPGIKAISVSSAAL